MFEWVYGNTVDDVDHRSISSATTTAATVPISPKISDDYVQSFLIRFSKALVTYGAPSHRLDHCVQLLMRKFGIKAQFGYFPGFLVVSFGDPGKVRSPTKSAPFFLPINDATRKPHSGRSAC